LICIQSNGYTYTISFGIAQVTPYAHGTSDLLGIQIDAAINPGLSFISAFCKNKKFPWYSITRYMMSQSIDLSCLDLTSIPGNNELIFVILIFCSGNSGGPAFNEQGECIGVAFQVLLLGRITDA
jgi:S1-C subfamily serine protease